MGLGSLVKSVWPQADVAEAATFANAVAVLKEKPNTAFVTLAMNLPDCEGLTGLAQLRSEFPEIPVIMLAARADEESVSRATAFGAAAYMSKTCRRADIIGVLKSVVSGRPCVAPFLRSNDNAGEVMAVAALSRAQFRILIGIQRGLRNKEIAFEMGVAEKTVKAYTTTLFRRLGVTNRAQALLLARRALADVPALAANH